ncbi:19487_t:CDS:2, partial [Dentiscutata erythropus]
AKFHFIKPDFVSLAYSINIVTIKLYQEWSERSVGYMKSVQTVITDC